MFSIEEVNKILFSLDLEDRKKFLETHINKLKMELKILITISSGVSVVIKENKDRLKDAYKDSLIFNNHITDTEKMKLLESGFNKYNNIHNEYINSQKIFIDSLEEILNNKLYES